jgi:hypothetical protein
VLVSGVIASMKAWGRAGRVVDDDVELADHDQHADPREHRVDDGGGDGAEPAAQAQATGGDLQAAGDEARRGEAGHAVVGEDLRHEHHQAGRGPADLQGHAGEAADDEAADDAGHEARRGIRSGRERDAEAEGEGDEEDDERGERLAGEEAGGQTDTSASTRTPPVGISYVQACSRSRPPSRARATLGWARRRSSWVRAL